MAKLKPQYTDAGHGGVSTATIFAAFDAALARHRRCRTAPQGRHR
jgi:hypothetical protein